MLNLCPLQSAVSALGRAVSVTGDAKRWQQLDAETQETLKTGEAQ